MIKDSWQCIERPEEGKLLEEATRSKLANVVRYYHHETVIVDNKVDDIQGNVRRGLDIKEATNYRLKRSVRSSGTNAVNAPSEDQSGSSAGTKRPASHTDASPPPSKRSCSASSNEVGSNEPPNRVHRRVILCDYGKAIYKASSRSALLAALGGCVKGHEALYREGILHRDISINNLMINDNYDPNDPDSSPSFLIDLDLATKVGREKASGAQGRTGTRAFMAIGVLEDEPHSFMHDLESFFWVLFWICIHYEGPGKEVQNKDFDKWNYMSASELAAAKSYLVVKAKWFSIATAKFTKYYKPLAPWMEELRKVIFTDGWGWGKEDEDLYFQVKGILSAAQDKMEEEERLEAGSSSQA